MKSVPRLFRVDERLIVGSDPEKSVEAMPDPEVSEPVLSDPQMRNRLLYFLKPFNRYVYRPIEIVVQSGESFTGEIMDVGDEEVELTLTGELSAEQRLRIADVVDIKWRGKSFPVRK